MIKRIISTLALWAVLVFVVYFFKDAGFAALMFALALMAGREACSLLGRCGLAPSFRVYALAALLLFLPMFCPARGVFAFSAFWFLLSVFFFAAWVLRSPYGDFLKKTVLPTFLIYALVAGMLWIYALVAAAMSDYIGVSPYSGVVLATMIIAAAKFSDVGGYLFGMAFGRHKMSPSISPKKTWEGAFGGVALSMLVTAAIAWGFSEVLSSVMTPLQAALMALPVAAAAIVSDLLESVLKRRADIKDSGSTIPGIGGALDLADSMLLSAPVGFAALFIIIFFF